VYNVNAKEDSCEAVVSMVVGQGVEVYQHMKVLNANDTLVQKVVVEKFTGQGMEELRKKLHEAVDRHINSYCDFVNGV
jgi:alpha-galactosidase